MSAADLPGTTTPAAVRPPIPGPLGRLLERAYRFELARRNAAADRGKNVRSVRVPVISVGNLSVGGTGKTPMVRTVVGWLAEAGHHPAIALRGYKAKNGLSDEAAEYQRTLPGVPLAVGPDRAQTITTLLNDGTATVDCVVLDDGFQHRTLARDIDLVLLDATRWPLDGRCLPAGWLREPPEALRRASAAVITRADLAPAPGGWAALAGALQRRFGHLTLGACAHAWDGLERGSEPAEPGQPAAPARPIEWLRGRPTIIACAIGNPRALTVQAESAGAKLERSVIRRDHHAWSAAEARSLEAALEGLGPEAALLTTGKDWVKLAQHASPALRQRVVLPRLTLRFLDGEPALRQLVLRAVRTGRPNSPEPV